MYPSTTDIASLCPYTGLRSFTEEESIYFKGRDGQIDVVAAQLAERKFLMLTGASGDGKSSLVYAGLIPQARSGFFKARYSNWCVVDFRPERTPLKNLINAVARSFQLDEKSVETELKRGFSSLADIYQNSSLYVGDNELSLASTDQARRQLKLGAANLLVIIDQFEEFFTNPENRNGDAPGADAQIVVNLMLETSRIALERGLPIYVVFTMRSDYIGQCNSFRGLPEFIGYSQFFVPRLNRGELKQVIEEPAELNGNSISRRLTERLISDLSEGIDQLPILQHALRQIWLQAASQNQEMDLIHYAMVGGLSADQLPDDDKTKFQTWVERLPENQRALYKDARMGRVIEIHARKLYDEAAGRYLERSGNPALDTRQIKRSIAITFACLTKIDNGRAVRNRMSLGEIAAIINIPQVTPQVLASILEIFRLPDNSFLRPFTFEISGDLSSGAVLDITHESLIRNWGMLHQWANQEYRYYTTFADLAKQLRRWKENGMSSGYLIPIGPLTFFEKWYEECQPNGAWIQRYVGAKGDPTGHVTGDAILGDLQRYLKLSARRVGASRLLVKYGARKIVGVFTLILVAIAAGYASYRIYENQSFVLTRKVISEGRALFINPDVPNDDKANFLVAEETRSAGEGFALLTAELPVLDRLTILWEAYRLLYPSPSFHRSQIRNQIIGEFEKIFNADEVKALDSATLLRARSSFVHLLATENHFDQKAVPEEKLRRNAAALYGIITGLSRTGVNADHTATFNESIQLWLTFGAATNQQIQQLISYLSPRTPDSRFNNIYKPGAVEVDGFRSLNYGGGYHTLATLYAAAGDVPDLLWCFEQQLSSIEYFTDRLFNTRSNVIGFLYQFGHRNLVPEVIAWHTAQFPQISAHQIYDDLVCRSAYLSEFDRLKFGYKNNESEGGVYSVSLCLAPRQQYEEIAEDYERSVVRLTDPAEREFLLALHYKRLGLFSERYHRERGLDNPDSSNQYYKRAFNHFNNLAEGDRGVEVTYPYYYVSEVRTRTSARKHLFLYPDVLGNWQMSPHHGDSYFNYMAAEGLLKRHYTSASELRMIPTWITNLWNRRLTVKADVQKALDFVNTHPLASQVDMNIARIMLARHYLVDNDTTHGLEIAKQINIPSLEASKQRIGLFENTVFLNELMGLCGQLAAGGHASLASEMSKSFSPTAARVIAYLYCVEIADTKNRPDIALAMLDSATQLIIPIKSDPAPRALNYIPHYTNAAFAVGNREHIALAEDLYRNSLDAQRLVIRVRRMRGLVERGKLREAYESIPSTLTESQDMFCRTKLLEFFTQGTKAAETENGKMYTELTEGRLWLTGFFNN